MTPRTTTAILAALALLLGSLAALQLTRSDLGSFFGAPARPGGRPLFSFNPDRITRLRVSGPAGQSATFEKRHGAWWMTKPTLDRADFRDLQRLVLFSRHLLVEEALQPDPDHPAPPWSDAASFQLRLLDASGSEAARYRLGRRTAWHRPAAGSNRFAPTYFVRLPNSSHDDHLYVCSTPDAIQPGIRQILDRGTARLRDHRPFLFDPATLARITIRNPDGEIQLRRPRPDQPWSISKPLEARTNPQAVSRLIQGLYNLQATTLHDPGTVTVPPRPDSPPSLALSLRFFDPSPPNTPADPPAKPLTLLEDAVTLTVDPPATANATATFARVTGRPDAVFEIPLVRDKDTVALHELPLSVDELRSRTLTSLDIESLRAVTIHDHQLAGPIRLTLDPGRAGRRPRWMIAAPGTPRPANEFAVANLLKAVTRNEVRSFASDAAHDPTSYGLDPPPKRLILHLADGRSLELLFGQAPSGRFHAMRAGAPTVAEITPETYAAIASRPHQWRDTLLLPHSIVDLAALRIEHRVQPPLANPALTLNYDFLMQDWSATQFGRDATPRLIVPRANKFIHDLDQLRVLQWLEPDDAKAKSALKKPVYRLTALFHQSDQTGESAGLSRVSLQIARASNSPNNQFYYGRLHGDPHFFLLDQEAARILAEPLTTDP